MNVLELRENYPNKNTKNTGPQCRYFSILCYSGIFSLCHPGEGRDPVYSLSHSFIKTTAVLFCAKA